MLLFMSGWPRFVCAFIRQPMAPVQKESPLDVDPSIQTNSEDNKNNLKRKVNVKLVTLSVIKRMLFD
jgi:hypothetical protein